MADEQLALVAGGGAGLNRPADVYNGNIRYNGSTADGREVSINYSGPVTGEIARHAFNAGTGHTQCYSDCRDQCVAHGMGDRRAGLIARGVCVQAR